MNLIQSLGIQIEPVRLDQGDALFVTDLQKDFLAGGPLAVPGGDQVISVMNAYIEYFNRRRLPVFATRDWHPTNHGSFVQKGGPWPEHCIAGSQGAEFADGLRLPASAHIISKGLEAETDGYSGFVNPDLKRLLDKLHVVRLFVGGLATDYCVLNTVCDALKLKYRVLLLIDAIRAVNVRAQDGEQATRLMILKGAKPLTLAAVL